MLKKILAGFVGLFLVLVLGLFLWARSILTTDTVLVTLASQIAQTIGQRVTIGGVKASIYPRITVTLTDVGIGPASEITIRDLAVGTDFRALLSRRIEHATVRVTGARVTLPLLPLKINSTRAPSDDPASVEIVSIDEIVLRGVEIVSGGRTLHGDIEVVPHGGGVILRKLSLGADDTTLVATGEITDLTGPVGHVALTAGALNLDQLIVFANDFSSGAGGSPSTNPAPGTAVRGAMNLDVTIAADRATIGRLAIDHISARAVAKGDTVSVQPLTFGLFGGRYEGTLNMTFAETPTFRWKATVSNIDVAAATAFAGSPNTVSGTLAANVDLLGKGADAATAMQNVRGSIRLDVTNGIIRNLGLVRSVGDAAALSLEGLQRASANVKDRDEPFSRLGASVVLADGTANTEDLQFDAADLSLSARGTVQLDASAINLRGRLQLSEALSQQVHQKMLRLSQDNGRVVFPATITGPVSAPTVRVDTTDIAKRALRNTAAEHAPNLIKRGLGGLIGK